MAMLIIDSSRMLGGRVLVSASAISIALGAAMVSALAQSACQAQLEAAILRITSSGPVRIVDAEAAGTDQEDIHTQVFVPPHSYQATHSGRVWAGLNPPPPTVIVGGSVYSGGKRSVEKAPIPNPIYELGSLDDIANPKRYYARSCSTQKIVLHYEASGSLDPSFSVRESELKKLESFRKSEEGGRVTTEPSELDLDAQGRPARLKIGEMRSALQRQQAPRNRIVTFTYDPALRIEAPK